MVVTQVFLLFFVARLNFVNALSANVKYAEANLEDKIEKIAARVEDLEATIRNQNKVMHAQTERTEVLEDIVSKQSEELDSQNKRIEILEVTVQELRSAITKQDTCMEVLKGKLKQQQLSDIEQDIIIKCPKENCSTVNGHRNKQTCKKLNQQHRGQSERRNIILEAMTLQRQNREREKSVSKPSSDNDSPGHIGRRLTPVRIRRVAFTAYLDRQLTHLGIDHPISFNKVLLNDGNAFNTHTGMFLCPRSGVYLFALTIESHIAGKILAKLVIDGRNQIDTIATGEVRNFVMGTNIALIHVTAGETVWVATYEANDVTLFNSDAFRFSSFSGVLLY